MDLEKFLFKNVIVIDTDGIEYRGYVHDFTADFDNEENEDSISITTDLKSGSGVELFASEIKSIKSDVI